MYLIGLKNGSLGIASLVLFFGLALASIPGYFLPVIPFHKHHKYRWLEPGKIYRGGLQIFSHMMYKAYNYTLY